MICWLDQPPCLSKLERKYRGTPVLFVVMQCLIPGQNPDTSVVVALTTQSTSFDLEIDLISQKIWCSELVYF